MIETIEAINLGLSIVLLLLGIGVATTFRKVDFDLLKARMFLKKGLIKHMWWYSSLAGALLISHQVFMFFNIEGYQILMTALLLAFILLSYSWYGLLRESIKK
jgi:hypothetical protein